MELVVILTIVVLGLLLWGLNYLSQKGKKAKRTTHSTNTSRPVSRWDASRRTAESYSDRDDGVKNYWSIRGGSAKKSFGKVTQYSKEGISWHNINHKNK